MAVSMIQPPRPNRLVLLLIASTMFGAWPDSAWAQVGAEKPSFPAERLRPGIDRESILDVESGDVGLHFEQDAALWLGYARNPLVYYRKAEDGALVRQRPAVKHRVDGHLTGALALFGRLKIGLDLPFVLYQGRNLGSLGDALQASDIAVAGVGDVRVVPKVALLSIGSHWLDVALVSSVTIPTGYPKDSYLGERHMTWTPEIAVSQWIGPMRVGANAGYRLRPKTRSARLEVNDEIAFRFGAALSLEDLILAPASVVASLSGSTGANAPFGAINRSPLEMLVGATLDVTENIQVVAGTGVGLVAGYGTPDFRFFCSLRYADRSDDRDGDGVRNQSDRCPDEPEDRDYYEDEDGCPETDDPKVEVNKEKLNITEKVYFDTGKARIKARSYPLLKAVAATLKSNPQIRLLRIEGHTDDRGDTRYNQELSQARAESVRDFLIGQGIAGKLLNAVGYGESRPIAPNASPRGRLANRRVEFMIEKVVEASVRPQQKAAGDDQEAEQGQKPEGALDTREQ